MSRVADACIEEIENVINKHRGILSLDTLVSELDQQGNRWHIQNTPNSASMLESLGFDVVLLKDQYIISH